MSGIFSTGFGGEGLPDESQLRQAMVNVQDGRSLLAELQAKAQAAVGAAMVPGAQAYVDALNKVKAKVEAPLSKAQATVGQLAAKVQAKVQGQLQSVQENVGPDLLPSTSPTTAGLLPPVPKRPGPTPAPAPAAPPAPAPAAPGGNPNSPYIWGLLPTINFQPPGKLVLAVSVAGDPLLNQGVYWPLGNAWSIDVAAGQSGPCVVGGPITTTDGLAPQFSSDKNPTFYAPDPSGDGTTYLSGNLAWLQSQTWMGPDASVSDPTCNPAESPPPNNPPPPPPPPPPNNPPPPPPPGPCGPMPDTPAPAGQVWTCCDGQWILTADGTCPAPTGPPVSCCGQDVPQGQELQAIAEAICLFRGLLAQCPSQAASSSAGPCGDLSLNVRITCIDQPVPFAFAAAVRSAVTSPANGRLAGASSQATAAASNGNGDTLEMEDTEEPLGQSPPGGWQEITLTSPVEEWVSNQNVDDSGNINPPINGAAAATALLPSVLSALAAANGEDTFTWSKNVAGILTQLLTLDWNGPGICTVLTTISRPLGGKSVSQQLFDWGIYGTRTNPDGTRGVVVAALYDLAQPYQGDQSVKAAFIRGGLALLNDIAIYLTNTLDVLVAGANVNVITQLAAPFFLNALENLIDLVTRYIPIGLNIIEPALDKVRNYLYPRNLPSVADANNAYLTGQISEELWLCWTRANDALDWPAKKVRDSGQSRLAEGDLVRAWLRRLWAKDVDADGNPLPDQANDDEFRRKLRQRGWLSDNDVRTMKGLSRIVPGPADVIRMMVRDVEDKNIVERFQLDSEFTDKFTGLLKYWAAAGGLSEDVMLREWRAHWQVPSFSQLIEMSWRLRPEKMGDAKDSQGFPWAVSREDLLAGLNQNDIAPIWRQKLAYISRRVLRQVDSRRAYNANGLSRSELESHYKDIGYYGTELRQLMRIADLLKRQALRTHWAVKAFIRNGGTGQGMIGVLLNDGFNLAEITAVKSWAESQKQIASQLRCLRAIQRQYNLGLVSDQLLPQRLQTLNLDAAEVNAIIEEWTCEKTVRGKTLSAPQLCKLAKLSLITPATYHDALVQLGYSDAHATLLASQCGVKPPPDQLCGPAKPCPTE